MRPKLVIWGAGGHALVVADIIRLTGEYELVGFLDDVNADGGKLFLNGLPIFYGKDHLSELHSRGVHSLLFTFGDCAARLRLTALVRDKGFTLAKAIHPRAFVAEDAFVGNGTIVGAGAVVNPGCNIGASVIVNTCASVDHECRLADGTHISPGAHLAGNVTVGRGSWIGVGAAVKNRINIGAHSIIGAGAVVLQDIPEYSVAFGVPARVQRRLDRDPSLE